MLQKKIRYSLIKTGFALRRAFLLLCLPLGVQAQLDNTCLQDEITLEEADSNTFGLALQFFPYMRNTEYFNKVEPGRTLFGYLANPQLYYQPLPYVKLQGGVFLRKDFGTTGYTRVQPTFTLKTSYRNWDMLFGTLEGALSHRIVEPMFNIASVIENRVENGFQLRFNNGHTFFDTWINWEKYIEPGSPFKEEFTAGLNFIPVLLQSKNGVSVSLPLQGMLSHRGGQIDTDTIHKLYVKLNSAIGLKLSKKFDKSFVREIRLEPYYLVYKENSSSGMPFTQGEGYYLNAFVNTSANLGLMLSYWKAENFHSPRGTAIYQMEPLQNASGVINSYQSELLFIRFLFERQLFPNLYMTARFEPFINFNNSLLDYSYSFYLSYKRNLPFNKR